MSAAGSGRAAQQQLRDYWQRPSLPLRLLWPLSKLYQTVAAGRRRCLTRTARPLAAPVIVVGNISVGGTGKTPLVLWLAQCLHAAGLRPGILSRGYGGSERGPRRIDADADPAQVGDEPVMLAKRLSGKVPVLVSRRRVIGAQSLIASGCDVVISDDGLQHYDLARDVEVAVVDGSRGVGNGWCLPAGPLREPPARLAEVDFVVINGGGWQGDGWQMSVTPSTWLRLPAWEPVALDHQDAPTGSVHAVAGMGNPARFFAALRQLGLVVLEHSFPDHHRYRVRDLCFDDPWPVVMTEKDAVKYCHLSPPPATALPRWCLRVDACLPAELSVALLAAIGRGQS